MCSFILISSPTEDVFAFEMNLEINRGMSEKNPLQTFLMTLPTKLRHYYDIVVMPETGAALSVVSASGKPRTT